MMNKKIFLLVGSLLSTMAFASYEICPNPHNAVKAGWQLVGDTPINPNDTFTWGQAQYNTKNGKVFCMWNDQNNMQVRFAKEIKLNTTDTKMWQPNIYGGYDCTGSTVEKCTITPTN